MAEFIPQTADQLPQLLKAFRRQKGLTQEAVAARLGVTQQTLSALELNAEKVSAGRLIQLLAILGVQLVLREVKPPPPGLTGAMGGKPTKAGTADKGPAW